MKKLLAVCCVFAAVFSASAATSGVWTNASYIASSIPVSNGTNFTITSAAQLARFAALVNGTVKGVAQTNFAGCVVKLGADLDLSAHYWVPIGNGLDNADGDRTCFVGTFDGQGHTVSHLRIDTSKVPPTNGTGFFGVLDYGGTVLNLRLADASIVATSGSWDLIDDAAGLGLLAGYNQEDCVIFGCRVSGSITNTFLSGDVGGIVGINKGMIGQCRADVSILAAAETVGGVAGNSSGGTIDSCRVSGSVIGRGQTDEGYDTNPLVGGIAGDSSGPIRFCVAVCRVGDTLLNNTYTCGGICGYCGGTWFKSGSWPNYFYPVGGGAVITNTLGACVNNAPSGGETLEEIAGRAAIGTSFTAAQSADIVARLGRRSGAPWMVGADGLPDLGSPIDYELNGGTWSDAAPVAAYREGTAFTLPTTAVRCGYTFNYWTNSAGSRVTSIAAAAIGAQVVGARWTKLSTAAWTASSSYYNIAWWTGRAAGQTEFTLTTAAQLAGLAILCNAEFASVAKANHTDFTDCTINLGTDIYLNGKLWTPIGDGGVPFAGTFNGNGHTIKNMAVRRSATDDCFGGLFGSCEDASIADLVLTNALVEVSSAEDAASAGLVVGSGSGTGVSGCSASGTVAAYGTAAGAVGLAVESVSSGVGMIMMKMGGSASPVSDPSSAGGIAGSLTDGSMAGCRSSVSVTAAGADACAGGLAGLVYEGEITASRAGGASVRALSAIRAAAGGVAGRLDDSHLAATASSVAAIRVPAACADGTVGGVAGRTDFAKAILDANYWLRDSAGFARADGSVSNVAAAAFVSTSLGSSAVLESESCRFYQPSAASATAAVAGLNSEMFFNLFDTEFIWQLDKAGNPDFGPLPASAKISEVTLEDDDILSYPEGYPMALPSSDRFGYTFEGWTNSAGQAVTMITAATTGNFTLGAKWRLTCGTFADAWYGQNPSATNYVIRTADELVGFMLLAERGNTFAGKTVTLGANIDLAGRDWLPAGDSWAPFEGTFNGAGFTIRNLHVAITTTNADACAGFFGCVAGNVRNLKLVNATVEAKAVNAGNAFAGLVAGQALGWRGFFSPLLDGCSVDGTVAAMAANGEGQAGGLVGYGCGEGRQLNIRNSRSTATVRGSTAAGGLVGVTDDARLASSRAAGTVTAPAAGGLVGEVREISGKPSLIARCVDACARIAAAKGNVAGVGGLVGAIHLFSESPISAPELLRRIDSNGWLAGGPVLLDAAGKVATNLAVETGEVWPYPGAKPYTNTVYTAGGESARAVVSNLNTLATAENVAAGSLVARYWTLGADGCPDLTDEVPLQSCPLKLDLAGGTLAGGTPTNYYPGIGLTLPVPTKTGYGFDGWADGAGTIVTQIGPDETNALSFTATWHTYASYPLALDPRGGTINAGGATSYYESRGFTLPTDVTRDCCEFVGWTNGAGKVVTEVATDATGALAFGAKWSRLAWDDPDQAATGWWNDRSEGQTDFTLTTAAELGGFADLSNSGGTNFAGCVVRLGADIDLAGRFWKPVYTFAGTFDGQGHAISNLTVDVTTYAWCGFFDTLARATVRGVRLVNGTIADPLREGMTAASGWFEYGLLAGATYSTTIDDCRVQGGITTALDGSGSEIGGLVGYAEDSIIRNCAARVDVVWDGSDAAGDAGGLVGSLDDESFLRNNVAAGTLRCRGVQYLGGLVGLSGSEGMAFMNNADGCSSVLGGAATEIGGLGEFFDINARPSNNWWRAGSLLLTNMTDGTTQACSAGRGGSWSDPDGDDNTLAYTPGTASAAAAVAALNDWVDATNTVLGVSIYKNWALDPATGCPVFGSRLVLAANGGVIMDDAPTAYAEGVETALPEFLYRAGYVFAGWTNAAGKAATAIPATATGTQSFGATWTAAREWTEAGAYSTAWHSAGTTNYTLTTAADLAGFAQLVNSGVDFAGCVVTLAADIDLAGRLWVPAGTNGTQVAASSATFKGTFDGAFHTVGNMTVRLGDTNGLALTAGLFGRNAGRIQRLFLVNAAATAMQASGNWRGCSAAGLVAGFNAGTIDQCFTEGAAAAVGRDTTGNTAAGGIAGLNLGSIRNCRAAAEVRAAGVGTKLVSLGVGAGGVVGNSMGGTVDNSLAFGRVRTRSAAQSNQSVKAGVLTAAGGIVGALTGGQVRNCAEGCTNIVGTAAGTNEVFVGGLAGYASVVVTNGVWLRDAVNPTNAAEVVLRPVWRGTGGTAGVLAPVTNAVGYAKYAAYDAENTAFEGNNNLAYFILLLFGETPATRLNAWAGANASPAIPYLNWAVGTEPYAFFPVLAYQITYKAGVGTKWNSATAALTNDYVTASYPVGGTAYSLQQDITRPGFDFGGWTNGAGEVVYAVPAHTGGNLAFGAKWIPYPTWSDAGAYTTDWYDASADSFTLTNAAQLAGLRRLLADGHQFKEVTFTLGAEIDLSGRLWIPDGYFNGTFDGAGHTVRGLKVARTDASSTVYAGLFAGIGSAAIVRNLSVSDASFSIASGGSTAEPDVGLVAGFSDSGSVVSNCAVAGSVIITGTSIGESLVGGVVGWCEGAVRRCRADCAINVTAARGAVYVGGIAGKLSVSGAVTAPAAIVGCTVSGTLLGTSANGAYVGGVVGYASGMNAYPFPAILNNTSFAKVEAVSSSTSTAGGGVVGYAIYSRVVDNASLGFFTCVSKGATTVGGVVGGVYGSSWTYAEVTNNAWRSGQLAHRSASGWTDGRTGGVGVGGTSTAFEFANHSLAYQSGDTARTAVIALNDWVIATNLATGVWSDEFHGWAMNPDNAAIPTNGTCIAYLLNGGVWSGERPLNGYLEGTGCVLATNVVQNGLYFQGWTNAAGRTVTAIGPEATGAVILGAKWSATEQAAFTSGSPVPVPYEWLEGKFPALAGGTDDAHEAQAVGKGANGVPVWASYALNLDPNDPADGLTLTFVRNADSSFTMARNPSGRVPNVSVSFELQEADALNGSGTVWTDFSDIASPITFTPEAGVPARFYRIKATVK